MKSTGKELEVKFFLSRRDEMEQKIIALGGRLSQPRVYEVNLRFDTPGHELASTGRLLRLRQDTRARMTYKGAGGVEGGARLRQELEFTVSDFATARELLEALGYQVQLMYEKYRTTYTLGALGAGELGDLEVVIDEMPYGDFAEIEGPQGESIREAAGRLGLDWDRRILESYTLLFEQARAVLGFGFRDLSFENFEGIRITPAVLGVKVADQGVKG